MKIRVDPVVTTAAPRIGFTVIRQVLQPVVGSIIMQADPQSGDAGHGPGLTEEGFRRQLQEIIQGLPVKIWLAMSVGERIDTLFSVGAAQGEPIRNFDHLGGFYLLGEGVPSRLIPAIHALFTRYCWSHRALPKTHVARHMNLKFTPATHREGGHNHLVIHVPFSVHSDV